MKEEGFNEQQEEYNAQEPPAQYSHEMQTFSDPNTQGSRDSLSKAKEIETDRKVNNYSRQSNKSARSRKEMPSFEDDNTEILAQLQAIQKVFNIIILSC